MMPALFRWLLLFVLCALLLQAADKPVSDDVIFDLVRRRLANDTDVRGATLDVHVENGVVRLRGKVSKQKAREKAERLAKKVVGVKKVINELRVEYP
jgi:osmotically-inducible protein OsmY